MMFEENSSSSSISAADPSDTLADLYKSRTRKDPPTGWGISVAIAVSCVFLTGFFGFWYAMFRGVPHASVSHVAPPLLVHGVPMGRAAKYVWSLLLIATLVWGMRRRAHRVDAWSIARQVTPAIVGQNLLVLAATATTGWVLLHLFPGLDRSWLYLLPEFHGMGGHAFNLAMLPLQIRYVGFFFLIVFAANIPKLARQEELQYRRPCKNWKYGVFHSLRFGVAHCLSGVPLFGGLALAVAGLWFTHQFFRGGVERSTIHHATYNWIVVSAAFVLLLFGCYS